jgi:hypothetical protein
MSDMMIELLVNPKSILTGQIFGARSLAYVVLILHSYSIGLSDLKLNFLAAMNVSF